MKTLIEKPDLTLYLGGTRSGKSARAEAEALQSGGPVLYVATAEARPDDDAMTERIRRHRARRPASWRTLECPLGLADRIAAELAAFAAPPQAGSPETGLAGAAPDHAVPAQTEASPGAAPASDGRLFSGSGSPRGEAVFGTGLPGAAAASFAREGAPGGIGNAGGGFRSASGPGGDPEAAPGDAGATPTILLDCVTLWVSNILFSLPDPEDLRAFEAAVRAEVEALLDLIGRSGRRWVLVSGETGLGGIEPTRLGRNYHDGLGLANQLIAARAREVFLVVAGRLLRLEA